MRAQDKTMRSGKRVTRIRAKEGMTPQEAQSAIADVALEYGARFVLEELKHSYRANPKTLNQALAKSFPLKP